ncbi:MAG TPA: hypothetical protein VGM56_20945, partial [Byssovorax sp.]
MTRPLRSARSASGSRARLPSTFGDLLSSVRVAVERRLSALWTKQQRVAKKHGKDVVAMVDTARDLTMRGGKRYRAAL